MPEKKIADFKILTDKKNTIFYVLEVYIFCILNMYVCMYKIPVS